VCVQYSNLRAGPGRYVCKDHIDQLTPVEVLGPEFEVRVLSFEETSTKDPVLVVVFPDKGGLLTYRKLNGFVHTLNTPSGLLRKLKAIGVNVDFLLDGV